MRPSRGVVLGGLLLLGVAQAQCVVGRGLSTPDERAKVVRLARSLELDPLVENAPETRKWLLDWMDEVPDIRFFACDALLSR